jgi:predicted XRE-type DNA-binding protein
MTKSKRDKNDGGGFVRTTVGEWLDLTAAQVEMIEVRVALAKKLRRMREGRQMTQADLAKSLGTSQPRVSKMEAGDPEVTLDLLIRSLLALGASRGVIGRTIAAS